jgi:hypothetical protein
MIASTIITKNKKPAGKRSPIVDRWTKLLTHRSQSYMGGMDASLVGTRFGHSEVACCQDVVNAIVLVLTLALDPVSAHHFNSFFQIRRFRETTTDAARRLGRRERTSLGILRATIFLEDLRIGGEDLPFLTENIGIVKDCCTIASQHSSTIKVAHEANAYSEMLGVGLFTKTETKSL